MENRFVIEQQILKDGADYVVGVDEAGRGPLAGPVVAAAVSFDAPLKNPWWEEINDSKKLSDKKRQELATNIVASARVGIGTASVKQIEQVNILQATLIAMRLAVKDLNLAARSRLYLLVDGNQKVPGVVAKQFPMVKGDSVAHSIAAASIIAKTYRDTIMQQYHEQFPEYGFAQHKGYGTLKHREAIKQFGLLDIHRPSFCQNINIIKK